MEKIYINKLSKKRIITSLLWGISSAMAMAAFSQQQVFQSQAFSQPPQHILKLGENLFPVQKDVALPKYALSLAGQTPMGDFLYSNPQDHLGNGAFGVVQKGTALKFNGSQVSEATNKIVKHGNNLAQEALMGDYLNRLPFRHPAIVIPVKLFDPNKPFEIQIAQDKVDGIDFQKALFFNDPNTSPYAGGYPNTLWSALGMYATLADGVAYLHANGILHRDLKPDNIMLQRNPAQPGSFSLKIIDFGIAVFAGNNDNIPLGTPSYMPSELLMMASGFSSNAFRWIFGEPLTCLPGFPFINYTQDSYALALLLPAVLFGREGAAFTSNCCSLNQFSLSFPSPLFLMWRDQEESYLLNLAQRNNPGNQEIAKCAQFSNFLVLNRFNPQAQAQVQRCDQYLSGVSRAHGRGQRLLDAILGYNPQQTRAKAKAYARQQAFQFIFSHFSSLNQRMYAQTRK
jgi:serine/threonine protein kinase